MARRGSHQEQLEDERPKRGLFWLLFRMPGASLLWLQYMFPAKGDVWGSARRYRNPGAEFLCTMMIYGGVAIAAYYLSQDHERPSPRREAETIAADTLYSDDGVNEPAPAGDVIVAAPEPLPESISDETPTYAPPDAEELAASPPEDPPY